MTRMQGSGFELKTYSNYEGPHIKDLRLGHRIYYTLNIIRNPRKYC